MRWSSLALLLLLGACGPRFPDRTIIREGRAFTFDRATHVAAWGEPRSSSREGRIDGVASYEGSNGFRPVFDEISVGDGFDQVRGIQPWDRPNWVVLGDGRRARCFAVDGVRGDWFRCGVPFVLDGLHWVASIDREAVPSSGPDARLFDAVIERASAEIRRAERIGKSVPRDEAAAIEWREINLGIFG